MCKNEHWLMDMILIIITSKVLGQNLMVKTEGYLVSMVRATNHKKYKGQCAIAKLIHLFDYIQKLNIYQWVIVLPDIQPTTTNKNKNNKTLSSNPYTTNNNNIQMF